MQLNVIKLRIIEETMSDFIKAAFHFTYNSDLHIYKIYTDMSHDNIFISTPYSVDIQ